MIDRQYRIRIRARAAIAATLAAVLAACSAPSSVSSTGTASPTPDVADRPVRESARESELLEIVVTARAPHPGEESTERVGVSKAAEPGIPSYIGKSPQATARTTRKVRVPTNAANETG